MGVPLVFIHVSWNFHEINHPTRAILVPLWLLGNLLPWLPWLFLYRFGMISSKKMRENQGRPVLFWISSLR